MRMASSRIRLGALAGVLFVTMAAASCHGGSSGAGGAGAGTATSTTAGPGNAGTGVGTGGPLPPAPSCMPAAHGSATVQKPTLLLKLVDQGGDESWLSSPAVADLDGDGNNEIIIARGGVVVVWNADGSPKWRYDTMQDRIWASPVVADIVGDPKLEVAVAARGQVFLLDASGSIVSGFPVSWTSEMRSLAAADLEGTGNLDLVAAPAQGSPTDVMNAWRGDGSVVTGFPPNQTGTSGCQVDNKCYLAGCYDQNVALGDLDGDGKDDVVVPMDDAYTCMHSGTGVAFDANPAFPPKKVDGVRYCHLLSDAEQGYGADDDLQDQFTNTAPAIADLDGDGTYEVVMVGATQNIAQTEPTLGVALWAMHHDGTRLAGWESPFYVSSYLAGLNDYAGTNIVAETLQVTVADIDSTHPGPELIFAGYDGVIHAVTADNQELWHTTYTTDPDVLTGGVVVADLTGDGIPEIIFDTYSTDMGKGAIFILDAGGNVQQQIPLPGRGAMAVPTIADVNGDGTLEIVVSLKDAVPGVESAEVWTVPGSSTNCMPWPTGRGNLLRNAWVRDAK
jgi:FG-GAP-like repeat